MHCLNCDGISFTAKLIAVKVDGRCIKCPAWVCDNCKEKLMDSTQMNECLNKKKKPPTLAERERLKIEKANKRWLEKSQEKIINQDHPWKKSYYKESIDEHVLNK